MRLSIPINLVAIIGLAAACTLTDSVVPTATETPTLVPTATNVPTLQPSITPEPPQTESVTPVEVTLVQLSEQEIPPPFDLTLPEGWERGSPRSMLVPDIDGAFTAMPVATFRGPVTGGLGYIVVFWGFPNLALNPLGGQTPEQLMWAEGLRIFRMAVVDPAAGCNPGTDLQTTFTVGGKTAGGARFSIVDCSQSKDARGWFAGLQDGGLNFVFFAYTEPSADIDSPEALEAVNVASGELQAILDSVRFGTAATPTPAP